MGSLCRRQNSLFMHYSCIIHESHGIIQILKKYFVTVFSVFNFNKNKLYPNGLIILWGGWRTYTLNNNRPTLKQCLQWQSKKTRLPFSIKALACTKERENNPPSSKANLYFILFFLRTFILTLSSRHGVCKEKNNCRCKNLQFWKYTVRRVKYPFVGNRNLDIEDKNGTKWGGTKKFENFQIL